MPIPLLLITCYIFMDKSGVAGIVMFYFIIIASAGWILYRTYLFIPIYRFASTKNCDEETVTTDQKRMEDGGDGDT
ncbi:hypothetical protein HDV02_006373, partial [Globomyces sp. JEL0801]